MYYHENQDYINLKFLSCTYYKTKQRLVVRYIYNAEIEEYNKVAVEVAKKHGFEINDLYNVSTSLPEKAHSDAVHYYTDIGTKAFADQVLAYVVPALGITDQITYKEALYTDKPVGI